MITLDTISYDLHSIQIIDAGGDALAIGADGSLNVTDNGGSLTVDATDLDIRDLTHVSDSVSIGDGTEIASVTASNQLEVAVTAALPAGTNNIGDVDVLSLPGSLQGYADGAVWSAGSFGVEALAVRKDAAGAFTGVADGDFSPLQLDSVGRLKVAAEITEAGYASWLVSTETVDTTAGGVQLVASPLTGRLRVEIQNLGTQDIYIKEATGVTTANGLKIPKGSSYEQALDDNAEIWAIAPSGSSDIRIAEYAA